MPAPRDLHNTEDHEQSPAHREVSAVIRIKTSNRRLPLCRKDVGLHLAPVQRRSPTSPEISQPLRSLMGNPSLNSPKLHDPRSQKENVRSLQGLPCWQMEAASLFELLARTPGCFLWCFWFLTLSLKLPSPAWGCCLPWICLHVH